MSTSGPLAGLRVVEFDAIGPVPMAAMILADLGCDVVRVARKSNAGGAWDDIGGAVLHRGRGHVRADLKDVGDRADILALVAGAEAVIEGFRPGVMERLGLGPDVCLAANPRLAYVRMTGWGQTGPLAPRAGHDINYMALTGALHAMGEPGRPPVPPLNYVGDYGGGAMFAVVGLLSAVMSARVTGRGQVVDVAMTDGVAVLSSMFHAFIAGGGWSDARGSNLIDGSAPFYRCYSCGDGGYVAVGALEPIFFANLIAGLGFPAERFVQFDRAGWPDMIDAFETVFLSRSRDAWAQAFEGVDACVSPVLTFTEATEHPYNRARTSYLGIDGVRQPAPAPRFKASPSSIGSGAALTMAEALTRWNAV